MNSSNKDLWNKPFSHIYVEKAIINTTQVTKILTQFPDSTVIPIKHYKDVFNRSNQNFHNQSLQRKLILATNQGQLVYHGAPVCQNFGQEYFYYTSNVLNCLYDCEYCYLQGMYPSANLVVFVNLSDHWNELEKLLVEHPVYVCISYDTDLLALEPMFHFVKDWIEFAKLHDNLTIEIRTKSANPSLMEELPVLDNIIYAWTLSPEVIQQQFEHRTPSLQARIKAVQTAIRVGHRVRLCFDPMLYIKDAKQIYTDFITTVMSQIPAKALYDVSFGCFRISKEYKKQLKRQRPNSCITLYPYMQSEGYYHYRPQDMKELLTPVYELLLNHLPADQIYLDALAMRLIASNTDHSK